MFRAAHKDSHPHLRSLPTTGHDSIMSVGESHSEDAHGLVAFLSFAILALAYALLLPSFEGPDEPEHSRHIEAWASGAAIEMPQPGQPPEWGYEIVQQPFYYWLLGHYARLVKPQYHGPISLNASQNPRFPFIRHDLPGHSFPWTGEHWGLRLLRLPSVLFGLLTAMVILRLGKELFPDDGWSRALFLSLSLLTPNILHIFAVVGNEGLTLLLSNSAIVLAIIILHRTTPSPWLFGSCGVILGLALATKLNAFVPIMTVGSLLALDMCIRRRWAYYLKGGLILGLPLLIIGGGRGDRPGARPPLHRGRCRGGGRRGIPARGIGRAENSVGD